MACSTPMLLTFGLLLVVTVLIAAEEDDVTLANAIVDWVRSKKGGFFSDKLEIRRMGDSLGVFASQDIHAHERLLNVPHECYIALWEDAIQEDLEDETSAYYYENYCLLSQKLAKEMKLGKDSDYAPFIAYVNAQKKGQIPATWSEAGKQVLRKVVTPGSDTVDWMELHFEECSPMDKHVVALTTQRGYDTTLIPLWDMFNHRNGHVNTENDPMYENDGLRVRASTNIEKGQEVYATYDECVDCRDESWYWGTPEILRDFGFVEQYRQRWIFYEQGIYFEIDMNENEELVVEWDIGDDGYGMPDEAGVAFLKNELERLQRVSKEVLKGQQEQIPANEWGTILQFHQAATAAISKAIESAESFLQKDKEL